MAMFFSKWDEINSKYDPLWSNNDSIPRWYEIVQKPEYLSKSRMLQEEEARKYVREYIKDAAGVDERRVEKWLLKIISYVHHDIFKYKDIFGPKKQADIEIHRYVYENQLRQILTYIPLRTHFWVLKEHIIIDAFLFCVLFFVPLLFIKIISLIILKIAHILK